MDGLTVVLFCLQLKTTAPSRARSGPSGAERTRESENEYGNQRFVSKYRASESEKGIDPAIVVGAVEEAIALATRKFYKTQENMRGELNKETGEITAYIYKTVVADDEQIEDPVNQITLDGGQ